MERRGAMTRRAAGVLLVLSLAALMGCGGAPDESPTSRVDRPQAGAASDAPSGAPESDTSTAGPFSPDAPASASSTGAEAAGDPSSTASPTGRAGEPGTAVPRTRGSRPSSGATSARPSPSRTAPAADVLGVPGWWPRLLALPAEARVVSVDRDRCELSWLAPVTDLDALAAAAVARAEQGGASVEERSSTTQHLPTASPGLGSPAPVPPLRHSVLTVTGRGVEAVLALDEMEAGGVLGRYRLTADTC